MKKITKAELKKRNAEFNALPPLKKRVAVAKDVLLQLKKGNIVAMKWYYGNIPEAQDKDLQQCLIDNPDYKCECCVKGAAVLAKARLGNGVTGDPAWNCDDVPAEVFGHELSTLLEVLFERWSILSDDPFCRGRGSVKVLKTYRDSLPKDPAERMRALYQNIVTNRGHFVVGDYKY